MLDMIVSRVITLLQERESRSLRVTQAELAAGLSKTVYLHNAQLILPLPDLAFIQSLVAYDHHHPAVATVLEAWAYGVRLHLQIHQQLLTALPLRELRRLPVTLTDHLSTPVQLATAAGLSYASVIHWRDCWVLLETQALISPLAREVMDRQDVKLIWQE